MLISWAWRAFQAAAPRAVVDGVGRQWVQYQSALTARRALRKLPPFGSYEDAVAFASTFDTAGVRIKPAQLASEIASFCRMIKAEGPRTLLELGTDLGGTLFLFCQAARPDAHLLSIDIPFRADATDRGYLGYHKSRRIIYRAFARDRQRVSLIQQSAHDTATLDAVRVRLKRPVDVLFVDADKTGEGVRRHFEMYGPLVRAGGIVAFHDIQPGFGAGDVPQFWRRLRRRHESIEIVESPSQEGYGIGVLRLP